MAIDIGDIVYNDYHKVIFEVESKGISTERNIVLYPVAGSMVPTTVYGVSRALNFLADFCVPATGALLEIYMKSKTV